ncbi:OLC1v1004811C1 [Oldenlandia corymbosa var. corymbosa]|uniref:OLC1v1004811C1 n=1 Tax=Oldenlandia corymbosa var. corymbosa TaxID=529605 RepID=A0AAV1DDX1_OLDCO|nr:OLC1v1004811C1 [Oldenlandia corymbosa var. corymbosa]
MVMSKMKYEEMRHQRMEENKKKLEQLHLPLLSQALHKSASSPKISPNQKVKPRPVGTELVAVRRSGRLTNKPTPDYKEFSYFRQVTFYERVLMPRRISYSKSRRDLENRVYASDEARAWAIDEAEKLESTLEEGYPSFVKPMLQSHVTGGFWLGLPNHFCKKHLPKRDDTVTLVDEQGEEWPTVYLAQKTGLSGGWRKFSLEHDLVDGDALVFQLTRPTVFKVYIIRGGDFGKEENSGED